MSLTSIYKKYSKSKLWPQLQGECGVYSFWYASLLLREITTTGHPEVHPRNYKGTLTSDYSESMRHWAKRKLRSGQGEILSCAEMVRLVGHFGYGCTAFDMGYLAVSTWFGISWGVNGYKKEFITAHLNQNHPILFAYWEGPGPQHTPVSTDDAAGGHWSVIIGENDTDYIYLDPHDPTKWLHFAKDQVLNSNAHVDDKKFPQFWGKPIVGGLEELGKTRPTSYAGKVYDLAQGGRTQQLKNVLVAVH